MSMPIVVDPMPSAYLEFVKQAYRIAMEAIHSVFPDPKGLVREMTGIKAEITGLKGELNGLAVGANAIKGEFNVFNAQYDLFKAEGALFDLNEIKQRARGEHPEQLKPRIDDLFRITGQLRQTALPNINSRINDEQRLRVAMRNRVDQIESRLGRRVENVSRITTSALQTATRADNARAQLDRRITAAARDATAALQGVRRVGGGQNQLTRRITTLERRQQTGQGGRGQDAAALRREGDRTRQAVRELTAAMRGAGPGSQQFKRQLDAIEQSLR